MRSKFRLDGVRELGQAMMDLPGAVNRQMVTRAAVQSLEPVRRDAEELAPKRTGGLSRSINISTRLSTRQRRISKKQSRVEVYVGPEPHTKAVAQEFGTFKESAQPYMRPAWSANLRKVWDILAMLLWFEIAKAAKRVARKTAKYRARRR